MMNEKRVREYREMAILEVKKAARLKDRYSWERRCERLWTLDFVLEEPGKVGYVYPEDRFPFVKTAEAGR